MRKEKRAIRGRMKVGTKLVIIEILRAHKEW